MSVRILVDRGIELRAEIAAREEELDDIETCLRDCAQAGPKVDLADAEREGKQFLAAGSNVIVPVVFTADKLVESFKDRSEMHGKIAAALPCPVPLDNFYKPIATWEMVPKSGKQFRRLADELLGKFAPALITACLARDKHGIPRSDIKIEWKRAEGIPANPR